MCKRSVMNVFLGLALLAAFCAQGVTAAEPARPKQLDLTYVTADVCGVIVLHPQQMARSPEVAALLKNEQVAAAIKELPFDPLKIEEVVGQLLVPSKTPRGYATALGDRVAVRFSPPVDIDNMAKAMLGGPRESRKVIAVTVAGKKCYKPEEVAKEPAKTEKSAKPVWRPPLPDPIACVLDDRTVLICVLGEADLKEALSAGEVKTPLVERLRRLDVSDDVAAVFALEPVREVIKEELARKKQYGPASPGIHYNEMALLLRSATVKLSLTDAARSSAVLEAEDAAGAAKVEELLKTFLQVAKDDLASERKRLQDMPEEFRKYQEEMMSAGEKLLDAITWTRSAAQVTITLKGSKGLLGELFAKQVSRFFTSPAGRTAAKGRVPPPTEGGIKATPRGDRQ
jgi:hypothetical protein